MNDLYIIHANSHDIKINTTALLRRLKISNPDESMQQLIRECINTVYDNASLRAVYTVGNIDINKDENIIDFGYMRLKSCNLRVNLADCNKAFVFVATLGIEIDRIIERYSKVLQTKALICDTVALFLIEAFCDYIEALLTKRIKSKKRFSPGYGDLDITCQRDIIQNLDTARRIGVTLTDSCMMIPTKSVSAIIGVKKRDGRTKKA
ncbi:MAG: Vitamin B12 dependent methionine synthase activation subunit [Clostridia bacterium]|nr:Vitamin B12 dependent methionine synthase activation subunit [Clostridia bacterium]